jgi:nucleoside-diphosphate-sugar epimerase
VVRQNLLIVGGTGFIGSHIVKRAHAQGWAVTSLSLKKKPEQSNVEAVEYLYADLTCAEQARAVLLGRHFDYVVNLGGYIDHSLFSENGKNVIDQHLNLTINLVKYIDVRNLKTFVQIGSSDEYGKNKPPQQEDQIEQSNSPYSFAKVASTQFLKMLHKSESYPAVIMRFFFSVRPWPKF